MLPVYCTKWMSNNLTVRVYLTVICSMQNINEAEKYNIVSLLSTWTVRTIVFTIKTNRMNPRMKSRWSSHLRCHQHGMGEIHRYVHHPLRYTHVGFMKKNKISSHVVQIKIPYVAILRRSAHVDGNVEIDSERRRQQQQAQLHRPLLTKSGQQDENTDVTSGPLGTTEHILGEYSATTSQIGSPSLTLPSHSSQDPAFNKTNHQNPDQDISASIFPRTEKINPWLVHQLEPQPALSGSRGTYGRREQPETSPAGKHAASWFNISSFLHMIRIEHSSAYYRSTQAACLEILPVSSIQAILGTHYNLIVFRNCLQQTRSRMPALDRLCRTLYIHRCMDGNWLRPAVDKQSLTSGDRKKISESNGEWCSLSRTQNAFDIVQNVLWKWLFDDNGWNVACGTPKHVMHRSSMKRKLRS